MHLVKHWAHYLFLSSTLMCLSLCLSLATFLFGISHPLCLRNTQYYVSSGAIRTFRGFVNGDQRICARDLGESGWSTMAGGPGKRWKNLTVSSPAGTQRKSFLRKLFVVSCIAASIVVPTFHSDQWRVYEGAVKNFINVRN